MTPPAFWDRPAERPGLAARVLSPLGALYAAGTARRLRRGAPYLASIPVICAGNLHAGGTGKTPTVMALIARLQGQDVAPMVVSRGYGGRLAGPLRVDLARHSAAEVGDEPLLLAAFAPVIVARDRAAGVRAAQVAGAQAVILDDGYQNPAVAKDLALVVVDAAAGFGNGRCLPAGPLREPVAAGLARADLLVSIGDPAAQANFTARWGPQIGALPRQEAMLSPLRTGMTWAGLDVLAFAGIGRPEKFFATLRSLGARVHRTVALGDHAALSPALMTRLSREATAMGSQLVTTEKDAVRLPPAYRGQVLTLPVRLEATDWSPLDGLLAQLFV